MKPFAVMKYRFLSSFFAAVLLSLPVAASADGGPALFSGTIPDARSAALGGAGAALTPDAYSLYRNGAASVLAPVRGEAGYGFTPWMRSLSSGSTLHSAAGFGRIGERHAVLAGLRYLSLPEMSFTDDRGNPAGTARPSDLSVEVGYAYRLAEGFAASVAVRYIRSDAGLPSVASAVGFDVGLYYRHPTAWGGRRSHWALGARFSDFGTPLDYGYGRSMLPWKIACGGALLVDFSDDHRLEASADAEIKCYSYGSAFLGGRFGAEYTLYRHAVLRAGYRLANERRGDFSYTSLGCGVRFDRFSLDGAYWLTAEDSPLRNTWQLSLRVGWGLSSDRRK